MILNLYQKVDILFDILEELLSSPFNKQFDDKAKHVLNKYDLEVIDGKIVKSQRRVSAEAKEAGYGESEDERIRKLLISGMKNLNRSAETFASVSIKDVIDWLEKQEQKSAELHKEDEQNLNACLGYIPDEFLRKWLRDIIHVKYDKPADMIEPKFKIGDWIVSPNGVYYQIYNIYNERYYITASTGENADIPFSSSKLYHKFSIQDAKSGDIVCAEPTEGWISPFIAIYKRGGIDTFDSYCFVDFDGNFDEGLDGHDADNIHPATKEQRDIFFAKMHEAGYTFDFKKKELKKLKFKVGDEIITKNEESLTITKIDEEGYWSNDLFICDFGSECSWDLVEQKSDWGEEDDYNLQCMVAKVTSDIQKGNVGRNNELIDWLKSLKERYTCKPSSELDEVSYQIGIKRVLENPESYGLTKYKWKPSDEQMKACKEVYADLLSAKGFDLGTVNSELNRLEEQLKKLKGE